MIELKFVDGVKFEDMPKFEGAPKFAGLDLAERTMEARVLCGGQKPQWFAGIGTGKPDGRSWPECPTGDTG